jgi:hypothetical protein
MAEFRLKKGTDDFDFDTNGAVKKNNAAFGKWSASKDKFCRLVVDKNSGGQETFDVEWSFNADNQLCLQQGETLVFNFHAPGARPFYQLENAVLKVRPERNHIFEFELRGEWDIDGDHKLSLTINEVASTIKGFIFDTRSRFMYHFFSDPLKTQKSVLGFVGQWEPFVDAEGVAKLRFKYRREDGVQDIFELPAALVIQKTTNQFMYEASSGGRTSRINFSGVLEINDDLELSYTIDRQVAQNGDEQVAQTTFSVGAAFHRQSSDGFIELMLKKQDGDVGGMALTLRAGLTARLGSADLQVGFKFDQIRDGQRTPETIVGFEGKLQFDNNGAVVWEFTRNATSTTLSIAATNITLGQARLDARLNIVKEDGAQAGVFFLLGVSF